MSCARTSDLNEFELIRRHFQRLGQQAGQPSQASDAGQSNAPWCALGIGDDAALIAPPAGQQLVICTDTLVAGRHFPVMTAAQDIGWKALAVNLSDLAAMGAQAQGFLLNLSLPVADEAFVTAFADGLFELADAYQLALIGGDTTRGPLCVTITAFGWVEPDRALLRSGAKCGDVIALIGDVGGAALALQLGDQAPSALRKKLDRPQPQLRAGQALLGLAHSAIDVSDGLAADLGHILEASGVGGVLDLASLPLHPALADLPRDEALALALHGGDDYALCITLSEASLECLRAQDEVTVQPIGRIIAQPGLYQDAPGGKLVPLPTHGYQHFS